MEKRFLDHLKQNGPTRVWATYRACEPFDSLTYWDSGHWTLDFGGIEINVPVEVDLNGLDEPIQLDPETWTQICIARIKMSARIKELEAENAGKNT